MTARGTSLFQHACRRLLSGERPWEKRDDSKSDPASKLAEAESSRAATSARTRATPNPDEQRWFADLLCLPVEAAALAEPLSSEKRNGAVLFDTTSNSNGETIRRNIRKLWVHALQA